MSPWSTRRRRRQDPVGQSAAPARAGQLVPDRTGHQHDGRTDQGTAGEDSHSTNGNGFQWRTHRVRRGFDAPRRRASIAAPTPARFPWVWRVGDDAAMLGIVTSASWSADSMRRPGGSGGGCRQAAQAGVRIGAQIVVTRSRRVRPALTSTSLGDLMADVITQIGGTAGTSPIRPAPTSVTLKPHERAVQHHRHRHSSELGGSRRSGHQSTPACRCSGTTQFGDILHRGPPPGTAPSPKVSPTAPTWRTPPWCPAASRAPSCTTPGIARSRRADGDHRYDHRGRRHAHPELNVESILRTW